VIVQLIDITRQQLIAEQSECIHKAKDLGHSKAKTKDYGVRCRTFSLDPDFRTSDPSD